MSPRVLSLIALIAGGCNWLSLASNALTYETLAAGEAGNIAQRDSFAFVTLGDSGLAVVRADDGSRLAQIAPPSGLESIDDVAVAGDLLFALDARPPGAFAVLSVRDSRKPVVLASRSVPVGPFSGISARDGVCVVSGGTSSLTAWRYSSGGTLDSLGTLSLGRGQPDVLLASASLAFVSTHYWGPYFGLDVIARPSGGAFSRVGRLELDGAGFTTGGARPANFPIETAVLGDGSVLVAYSRGVAVIDVTRPSAPMLVEVVDVGGPATHVDAIGDSAVVSVAGSPPSIAFVAFANGGRRASRVRRVTLPPGTIPAGIALSTRTPQVALVAARDRGVLVVSR